MATSCFAFISEGELILRGRKHTVIIVAFIPIPTAVNDASASLGTMDSGCFPMRWRDLQQPCHISVRFVPRLGDGFSTPYPVGCPWKNNLVFHLVSSPCGLPELTAIWCCFTWLTPRLLCVAVGNGSHFDAWFRLPLLSCPSWLIHDGLLNEMALKRKWFKAKKYRLKLLYIYVKQQHSPPLHIVHYTAHHGWNCLLEMHLLL